MRLKQVRALFTAAVLISIPSDLGVYFLQQEVRRRFGQPCSHVKMRVKAIRGGASGGTIASLLNVAREAAADPAFEERTSQSLLALSAG